MRFVVEFYATFIRILVLCEFYAKFLRSWGCARGYLELLYDIYAISIRNIVLYEFYAKFLRRWGSTRGYLEIRTKFAQKPYKTRIKARIKVKFITHLYRIRRIKLVQNSHKDKILIKIE